MKRSGSAAALPRARRRHGVLYRLVDESKKAVGLLFSPWVYCQTGLLFSPPLLLSLRSGALS